VANRLSPAEERFMVVRRQSAADGGIPPPPFQVSGVHLKHIGVRFAPGVVDRLLPNDLEPADGQSGLITVYSVASGNGIAGFTVFFAALAVKGYDAPDGSPGHYIASGHYSGDGGTFMRRFYNLNVTEGESRQYSEGDLKVGVGTVGGFDVLKVALRPLAADQQRAAGFRNYLGRYPGGGTCVFPIAFSGVVNPAEPVSVEIDARAPELDRLARPTHLTFAFECTDLSLTYGLPQRIDAASRLSENAARTALINGFAHSGRAAIVVSEAGEVGVASSSARALLGDGLSISMGRLSATRGEDQTALATLIAAAARDRQSHHNPIAVRRKSGQPLIIDAVPIGDGLIGRNAVLLLLNDPDHPAGGGSGLSLQLLGLTPAEARIAELVGSGLSPKETAREVDNSEGTVRTSLARIYGKLGINRQAELARLVTRLEIGAAS
jgi:DNA-binding CsgD family transcriptional regulator